MKKTGVFLLILMLTACGAARDYERPVEQPEYDTAEYGAGTAGSEESTEKAEGTEPEKSAITTEHVYGKESVLYSEPRGLAFRKDLEKTRTDCAVYYFEPGVSEEERNGCIETTDRMLCCVDAALPAFEIVVLEPNPSYGAAVSGNRLYLPVQQWDSVDYLAKVLLSGYGEWGNYGLAYGYADYLYKKAGGDGGERNAEEREMEGFLPMSAPELYDLNLLCFDERFGSAEDVKAAKNNACLFVQEYLSSHSEEEFLELLTASGTLEGAAEAKKALEEFYAKNGVECSLTDICYQYGGLTMDYAAACEYAFFHVARDWQDRYWEQSPMVSENFLHEDYGGVRAFFEDTKRQMGQYQKLFGFDSYDNSLVVRIEEFNDKAHAGIYFGGEHVICLNSVRILMHEYIHSLMYGRFGDAGTKWKVEGFAQYFDYKYSMYAQSSLDEYTNNDYIHNEGKEWVQEYVDFIGRPVYAQTDYRDLEDHYVYYYGVENPNYSYDSGASFVGYLIEQYGEQSVIAYVLSDNEYNADWDKSYDELVQDWNQYIEEKCSNFSKN